MSPELGISHVAAGAAASCLLPPHARAGGPPQVPWLRDVAGCVHTHTYTHARTPVRAAAGCARSEVAAQERPGIKQVGQKGNHLGRQVWAER